MSFSNRPALQALGNRVRQHSPEVVASENRLDKILRSLNSGVLAEKLVPNWRCMDRVVRFYFPEVRLAIDVVIDVHAKNALSEHEQTREVLAKTRVRYALLSISEIEGDLDALVARLRREWKLARDSVKAVDAARQEKLRQSNSLARAAKPRKQPANRKAKSTVVTGGWTSLSQGTKKVGDFKEVDHKRYVDEGIAGSRADNRKMRGQLFGDMRKRSQGK